MKNRNCCCFEAALLILIIQIIGFNSTLLATTYYIDPSGNNYTGNGSAGAPWQTLYYGCSRVTSPGDIIHVNAGTYYENTTCFLRVGVSIEGTGNSSVITRNYSNEWIPIIDAQSTSATNGNQSISYLKFDGNSRAVAQAIWIEGRHNVKIHHCTFINFNYIALVWTGIGGTEESPPVAYVTGSEFYNNTVTNCAGYGGGWYRGALFIGGQDGMLIYNNNMVETGRAAGTQGWPIKNWANGGWIKGCKIYGNHLEKTDNSVWDFCIESLWEFGLEIYNNTVIGAIDLNNQEKGTYNYAVYIHNNTLGPEAHGEFGCSGIILEYQNEGIIIKYNHFKNCSPPLKFTPRDQNTQDFDFSYNVVENCANTAGYYGGIRFISSNGISINHFSVQNNVFYGSTSDNPLYAITVDSEGGTYAANDFKVINNIFVNFNQSYLNLSSASSVSFLNVENNLIYNCGNNNLPDYNGTPSNYTYRNNKSGVNPLFVSTSDYHLQAGSPAIKAGKDIGMSVDYEGNAVASPPSIGAIEYNSSPPPTAIPEYVSSIVEDETPSLLSITFSLNLANIIPVASAFSVFINSIQRPISTVTVIGTKVLLTLDSPVGFGDVIMVSYYKTDINPLQTTSGGLVPSFSGHYSSNSVKSILNSQDLVLKIYPNPSQGDFTILINKPLTYPLIVRISNIHGMIVFESSFDMGETIIHIPVSLSSGMYLVQGISNGSGLFAEKIIISN